MTSDLCYTCSLVQSPILRNCEFDNDIVNMKEISKVEGCPFLTHYKSSQHFTIIPFTSSEANIHETVYILYTEFINCICLFHKTKIYDMISYTTSFNVSKYSPKLGNSVSLIKYLIVLFQTIRFLVLN